MPLISLIKLDVTRIFIFESLKKDKLSVFQLLWYFEPLNVAVVASLFSF